MAVIARAGPMVRDAVPQKLKSCCENTEARIDMSAVRPKADKVTNFVEINQY